ncbi:hypothetical protein Tco_1045074 [Tanacetum coccineum]|uniref:Uncharacterized protein n=1 Tax=Tanacetum coccineum TaxID=301880 RepID=A0ABQ5GST8_9ASTR
MISASTCYFDVTISTSVFEEQIAYTRDLVDFGVAIHTSTILEGDRKMKLFQDMQLIQKLRDDQKRVKKVFEDMSGSYVQKSNKDRDLR